MHHLHKQLQIKPTLIKQEATSTNHHKSSTTCMSSDGRQLQHLHKPWNQIHHVDK